MLSTQAQHAWVQVAYPPDFSTIISADLTYTCWSSILSKLYSLAYPLVLINIPIGTLRFKIFHVGTLNTVLQQM